MRDAIGQHVLTDEAWAMWGPLIEEIRPHGKTPPKELRRTISAIFCPNQDGAKWRGTPTELFSRRVLVLHTRSMSSQPAARRLPRPDFADVPDARRRNLAAVRGRDTKPEMVVRRLLHAMGCRYRLQRRDLPGKPDIVLPGRRAIPGRQPRRAARLSHSRRLSAAPFSLSNCCRTGKVGLT